MIAVLLLVAAGVALVTGWDDASVRYLLACALVFAILGGRSA